MYNVEKRRNDFPSIYRFQVMCFISAMRISSYPHELPKGHYYCINVCVLGVSLLDKTNRKCCMHGKRHLPTLSKCACKMVGAIVFKVRRSAYIHH